MRMLKGKPPYANFGRIVVLIACEILASTAEAAPAERALSEYQKREWQVEDGLPQGNVRTIVQSPDGALLVGTGGQMVSFDELRFNPVKVDDRDESRRGETGQCPALRAQRRSVDWHRRPGR